MAQFINLKQDLVAEAIGGLLAANAGSLARLDGFPHIRVVLRTDWDKTKVALVSGGGAGHEPAHTGYVGQGMLTAAVCGDVFASPSADAIFAAILSVTGPAGCLLIVKNYTGDRLNFGLAAERARSVGLNVNLVIVADDIALPDLPQPRGLAGTLLVHKIAGAMADDGADLASVTAAAKRVASASRSIGMSLDTCTIPGSAKMDRVPEGKAELGLGIHGEPGIEQIEFSSARSAMAAMVAKLKETMEDRSYVALINNLGGASVLEMSVLTRELLQSEIGHRISHLIGPAPLMTSLDMHGFSITLYPASEQELAALGRPVPLPAWPGAFAVKPAIVWPLPDRFAPQVAAASQHQPTRQLIVTCCELLISLEQELNELDARSGDGDTGSTLAGAARTLLDRVDRLPLADHPRLLKVLGQELSETMGGSSGVLLAIFFAAAGDAASAGSDVIVSLSAGLARMQEIGGAMPGDRTMVDALAPALKALKFGLNSAAVAARAGADATADLVRANAGRAAYVNATHLKGFRDPGAEAVARLLEQLATAADTA